MSKKVENGETRFRILVAGENNPLFLNSTSFFTADAHDVFFARDGCQAYSLAKQILPAIVILEQTMPVLDGEECCRLIKGEPRLQGTSVVLIAEDADSRLKQARNTKADIVLCKPLNRQNFHNLVKTLLENKNGAATATSVQGMFVELPNLNRT